MNIYTTFSESHEEFLPWFNSIKVIEPSLIPVYCKLSQQCLTGEFNSKGWNETTAEKLKKIIEIFDDSNDKDDYFIFSDVDVQFFRPIWNLGQLALQNHDIVFQNDYHGAQCTGFFYCKRNSQTKKLFETALKIHSEHRDDQTSVQSALRIESTVKHALLPKEFFTYGMFYNLWRGHELFKVPRNIVMHHANWVVGVQNKIKLLQATKTNFEQQNFIE